MSHYRLNDVEPTAIVTVNGSEKKIYDNNQIFLNPNDNFEIRFFNPLQEQVGVEIIFNGKKKDNSLLILNPGEDITLDRFLDDNKKMKFSTYFIDEKNEQAKKAIENNGNLEIKFYKEKHYYNNTFIYNDNTFNDNIYRGSVGFQGGNMMYYDGNISLGNTNTTYTYSTDTNGFFDTTNSININSSLSNTESKLETGRVEKGEKSEQVFEKVNTQFESFPFHTVYYELKPNSVKPKKISEIRNYCPDCGYRIRKKTWKFCPKCGEEL